MNHYGALGLCDFLRSYPRMLVKPISNDELNIEGRFDFTALSEKHGTITDHYQLRILVPPLFPRELPVVYEIQGRIPRNEQYHVNPNGSLCLGSRLRVLWKLGQKPTIVGFAENCLVPFLFAISHKHIHGGAFPFGELAHGPPGELIDYVELFRLKTSEQAKMTLRYLGMKKRRANKLPCPCGCIRRLGACHFNRRVKQFRQFAERSWFRLVSHSIN